MKYGSHLWSKFQYIRWICPVCMYVIYLFVALKTHPLLYWMAVILTELQKQELWDVKYWFSALLYWKTCAFETLEWSSQCTSVRASLRASLCASLCALSPAWVLCCGLPPKMPFWVVPFPLIHMVEFTALCCTVWGLLVQSDIIRGGDPISL